MFYLIFLAIMDFLQDHFGYIGALRIKDYTNDICFTIIGAMLILEITVGFIRDVSIDPNLESDIAIWLPPNDDGTRGTTYLTNPQTRLEYINVVLGYVYLRVFKKETIYLKHLRAVMLILRISIVALLLMGVLLSYWNYLPNTTPW